MTICHLEIRVGMAEKKPKHKPRGRAFEAGNAAGQEHGGESGVESLTAGAELRGLAAHSQREVEAERHTVSLTTSPNIDLIPDPLVLCFLRAARRGRELRVAQAKRRSEKSKRTLRKLSTQSRASGANRKAETRGESSPERSSEKVDSV